MLESARDLGFDQEPLAADGVVGMLIEDLLECDFAVKFLVKRDENRPEAAGA